MAKNEIVNVLTIKTEESQKTIKGLKKEIQDLKKVLENTTIGTEEFDKASKDLVAAQNTLKAALNGNKQQTEALAGSYDALVAEMAELKKVWRATNDEAKRSEIGKEIDNINTQLKELDATIGNNQRKVGAYAEEFGKALEKNNNTLIANADEFKKALAQQDDATISTRTKLESLQKVTAGLASGYAAVQGVTALLGIENENLEKTFVKLQSAMAIAQGVGGLKDLVEGLSRGKVAFAGALNGCKAFIGGLSGVKKALIGTGIGAFVVLLGVLVANWDKVVKAFKGGVDDVEDVTTAIDRLNNKLTENKEKTDQLKADTLIKYAKNIAAAEGDIKKVREELEKLNEEEEKNILLGFEMNINTAKDEISKTEKAIEKAKNRLEQLNKQFEQSAKNDQWSSSEYSGVNTGRIGVQIGNVQENIKTLNETLNKQKKILKDAQDELDVYNANKTIKAAENAVKTEDDKQKKIVDAATATAERQKEIDEELRLSKLNDEDKLIDALDKKYLEYMKVYEGNQKKQLEIFNWYTDEYMKIVERGIDEQIAAQQAAAEESERIEKEKKAKLDATSREKITTQFASIDKDAEKQLYTAEREKTATTSPWGDIDTEIAKLENVKNITEQILTLKLSAIDAELQAEYISEERRAELLAQRVVLQETTNQQLDQLNAQYEAQQKKRTQTIASFSVQAFTQALAGASQLISALQANIDTTTEEGFEKSKEMQKANVWINTAGGILSAIASAWQLGPIAGAIVGSINAAFTLATGIAQIANINKQKFDSASAIGGSSSTPSVTPYINQNLPVTYTRNVQSNSETENLNQPIRAYVVESDLNDAQKREMARQQNSEF